jgi:hypothetical protein
MTKTNREETINWLVNNDLNDWNSEVNKNEYLANLLKLGFTGYENMTDKELQDEKNERVGA